MAYIVWNDETQEITQEEWSRISRKIRKSNFWDLIYTEEKSEWDE